MKKEDKNIRGPIAWMASHAVVANLIMAFCLVGGFLSLDHIKQEVFPDIARDQIRINVSYPGASPEEVELGMILAIEQAIYGLEGIDEINSNVQEGSGTVYAELIEGTDRQQMAQDIKSLVDRISTFPEDAEEPKVSIAAHKRHVVSLVLYGKAETSVLQNLGELVREQLLRNADITQVELSRTQSLEISIEVSRENLRRYNLTLEEIVNRLKTSSVDISGGSIKTKSGEVLIRMNERRNFGWQFAQTAIISTSDGTEVKLGDIAVVKENLEERDYYAAYNGQPSVRIEVYRVGDQTPIQIGDAVHKQVKILNKTLPEGIKIDVRRDRSEHYRQRVDLLLRNAALGTLLVLVVLSLFLELRLAFWVMLGIPISFMGSLLILPLLGVTLNMMSLFAYIIVVGIVVDDAIIVGENIYFHHQKGMPFLNAAIKGAHEMAVPVTFAILTNVITFLPIYFIPGFMGQIFKVIPVIAAITFIISLLESLFILPAHLGHQRDPQRRGFSAWLHNRQQGFSHGFNRWVQTRFGSFLQATLKRRYLVLIAAFGILVITLAYVRSGRMGFSLFPKMESDFAQVEAVLPYGTPIEKTKALMERIHSAARKVIEESGHHELIKGIFAQAGRGGSHNLSMRVYLAPPEVRERTMSTEEFTRHWRKAVGPVSGVDVLKFESDAGGPGRGSGLTIELSHQNVNVLTQASTDLAVALEQFSRVKDIESGFQLGKEQLNFKIKPEGQSLGLTAHYVAREVRNAFYGIQVLQQQRGRNELKVVVRLPEQQRISEYHLEQFMLRTPSGVEVPLQEVVEIQRGRAYMEIRRRNGRRVIHVKAAVTPRSSAGEIISDLKQNALPGLIERYPGLNHSFEGKHAQIRKSMSSLQGGFILALLAIFAMLAIPLNSYLQPLIVMVAIPFGVVGAIWGHVIMGFSLAVVSMFGIVALSGVVVNDVLILITFANQRIKQGLSVHRAILEAAMQRFRPIILTTITTFCGLAPMMFEQSRQARFLIPIAISLAFGILFATMITLILVPSLYIIIDDMKRFWQTFRRALGKLSPLSQARP